MACYIPCCKIFSSREKHKISRDAEIVELGRTKAIQLSWMRLLIDYEEEGYNRCYETALGQNALQLMMYRERQNRVGPKVFSATVKRRYKQDVVVSLQGVGSFAFKLPVRVVDQYEDARAPAMQMDVVRAICCACVRVHRK